MPFSSTVDHVKHPQVATLGLMAMDSASELGKKVDDHLRKLYHKKPLLFKKYSKYGCILESERREKIWKAMQDGLLRKS